MSDANAMKYRIDHLMWGAPSLEAGINEAVRLFGVEPAPGGSHPGLGTCNALLSLGDSVYLEIIAPDPVQEVAGTFGERLQALSACGIVTWAAGCVELNELAKSAAAAQLRVRGPTATQRTTLAGDTLRWELLFLSGHDLGNLVPFFIDWQQTPHPATTNPVAGKLQNFTLHTPTAEALGTLFSRLGIGADIYQNAAPEIVAEFETAAGPVTLSSTEETLRLGF